MSDINTAPTQLTEPKKYKTKFCFAVIPAAILTLLLSFSIIGIIAPMFTVFSQGVYHGSYIIMILSTLSRMPFWILFSIALLLERPNNLLIPISLGSALTFPSIVSIIGNSIISKAEGWKYTNSLWNVLNLIMALTVVAVCVMFTIKAPALKSFMKKTGIIWSIAIPSLYMFHQIIQSSGIHIIICFLETITLFLLYFWLANPYKEVTAVQTNPAPQYAQPVAFVQPVAVPVNPAVQPVAPVQVAQPPVQPVVQPVPQVPVAAPVTVQTQTSVADEITKYKALLDTGAITPEEFEALKVKLINKI